MPAEESLSPAILSSVVDTNTEVLGNSPAESVSMVYQALAHSIGLSLQSAQANNTGLLFIGTAVVAVGTTKILSKI